MTIQREEQSVFIVDPGSDRRNAWGKMLRRCGGKVIVTDHAVEAFVERTLHGEWPKTLGFYQIKEIIAAELDQATQVLRRRGRAVDVLGVRGFCVIRVEEDPQSKQAVVITVLDWSGSLAKVPKINQLLPS